MGVEDLLWQGHGSIQELIWVYTVSISYSPFFDENRFCMKLKFQESTWWQSDWTQQFYIADAEKYSTTCRWATFGSSAKHSLTSSYSMQFNHFTSSAIHSTLFSSSVFNLTLIAHLRLPWACLDSADFLYWVTFILTCLLHLAQYVLRPFGMFTILRLVIYSSENVANLYDVKLIMCPLVSRAKENISRTTINQIQS